jgi:hypothetical protein
MYDTLLSPYDIITDLAVAYYGPGVREVFTDYSVRLDVAGAFDSLSPPDAERSAKVIGVIACSDDPVGGLRQRAADEADPAVARALLVAAEAW